ncbi:MAG: hypothetical protein HYV36_00945 [Lentisphaerae bacterium]|nr:hypothetical protein [Lentisphaerota bacterium]
MKKNQLILLLLPALLGLWSAALVHERLRDYRERQELRATAPLENAPPLMAFTTVALGGFRGLIADLLWLRAMRGQQEGRIFEIVQLADWITKLEPHFTTVWVFQAWNMAYNISVLFPDAENRWRWVQNGIRLLRDEALRYNPRDPNLYRELGWLYQHKLGYIMDSAHPFYKRRLAETMHAVLHGARAGKQLTDKDDQRLREEWKLDPTLMRQLDAEYGPLDWRLPETQALYWAWRGRTMAAPGSAAARACDQMIFQCLSTAFRQGRLDFDPATDTYVTTPYLELLPQAIKSYEEAIRRHDEPLFRAVYANFLGEAIVILHCYGREASARALYQQALRRYPREGQAMRYEDFINESFAWMRKNAGELAPPDAVAVVEGFLFQARGRKASGNPKAAEEFEAHAQAFWDTYMRARESEDHRARTGLSALETLRQQAERRAQTETNSPAVELSP